MLGHKSLSEGQSISRESRKPNFSNCMTICMPIALHLPVNNVIITLRSVVSQGPAFPPPLIDPRNLSISSKSSPPSHRCPSLSSSSTDDVVHPDNDYHDLHSDITISSFNQSCQNEATYIAPRFPAIPCLLVRNRFSFVMSRDVIGATYLVRRLPVEFSRLVRSASVKEIITTDMARA